MIFPAVSPGQASLPDTCSVCAHTPISPGLCKPNKALRTTLKAFLRTEEKKREKGRQSTTPVNPVISTPVENDTTPTEATTDPRQPDESPVEIPESAAPADSKPVEPASEAISVNATADAGASALAQPVAEVRHFSNITRICPLTNLLSPSTTITPNPVMARVQTTPPRQLPRETQTPL